VIVASRRSYLAQGKDRTTLLSSAVAAAAQAESLCYLTPLAAADLVLARFLSSARALFGAMLHQFLSAEAVQVAEERALLAVLWSLFGVLFLGHVYTLNHTAGFSQ
jgi:hypothetical protein